MKIVYDERTREIKNAVADMNIGFWKDIFDKNAMLLKVYASDEYIDRFGDRDAVDCLQKIAHARSMMEHHQDRKERWA